MELWLIQSAVQAVVIIITLNLLLALSTCRHHMPTLHKKILICVHFSSNFMVLIFIEVSITDSRLFVSQKISIRIILGYHCS